MIKDNIQIDHNLMLRVRARVVNTEYKKGDIKTYVETAIKEKLDRET